MKKKTRVRFNKIILIPTDFSPVCENAIAHGIEMARFLDYSVCILHVIDKKDRQASPKENMDPEQFTMQLLKCREKYERLLPGHVDILTREGNLFTVINQVGKELKSGLMILGTHGKQGLQHLFGSHALKVVLDSPCPVVVVQKRSFGKGYKKIVLPISSEIEPRQAVGWVMLMHNLFGSRIMIYQALEPDATMNNQMNSTTRQILAIFKENKIKCEVAFSEQSSDFSLQVISHAAAHKADLIMIMTMPALDLTGFSFTAWNEKIMFNEAQIPVMCINPVETSDSFQQGLM